MPQNIPALQMPEQPDILGKVGQFMQLKNMMAQQQQQQALAPGAQQLQQQAIQSGQQDIQAQQLKLKKEAQQQQDQQTIQTVSAAHGGDLLSALPDLQGKIAPETYQGIVDHIDKKKLELASLKKVELENQKQISDNMLGLVDEAGKLPPDQYQQAWPQIAARALELNPKLAGQIDPAKPIPQESLQHLQTGITLESQLAAQSLAKRQAAKEEREAADAQKTNDIKNFNFAVKNDKYKGTLSQWIKENKTIPEAASGTWSLQENPSGETVLFNNKTGEQKTAPPGLAPKGTKLKSESTVTGIEPGTGKAVQVSQAEAIRLGLTDVNKTPAADVSKTNSARHWLELANKKGNPSDATSMGILPIIEKLDKAGKLGVLASRWNDFMAGDFGAGDPDFEALRTKMGLGTTLLMQAHVGNRGGSFMLEHFEDLANAKKMDAATLKSGIKSEIDYMKDRAMMPSESSKSATSTVKMKAPNGQTSDVPADQVEHFKSRGAVLAQ